VSDDPPVEPLILLVDDHQDNLDLYEQILQFKGYRVETATNGAEALARAAANVPDLIVMDLGMPVMDGWEATRRLREVPATAETPIVVLTAHGRPQEQDRAEAAGCDAFLTKPFLPEELEVMVRNMLKVRRG
jgi:CheY-like chemotaxis protein